MNCFQCLARVMCCGHDGEDGDIIDVSNRLSVLDLVGFNEVGGVEQI